MTRISKPPQERKREILDTALALFLKNGYENTAVGDIVEKIGVTQGLFYYYFRSKEEVYRAAMEQYADRCTEEMTRIILDALPLREKLERILRYMADLISASEHAMTDPNALSEHLDMDNRFSIHMAQSLIDPVTGLLETMNEGGLTSLPHPEATATFLIFGIYGLIHGSPDHNHDPDFFQTGEVADMIGRLLGISPEQWRTL